MSILSKKGRVSEKPEAASSRSLAMAYDIKRKNSKPKSIRKMSDLAIEDPRPQPSSMAEAIMSKRKERMMAEGGMVDLDTNAEEGEADLDELNEAAAMKEQYDDSQLSAQPMDSNTHGDDIDSDLHDMVSKIRAAMKANRS